MDLFMLGLMQKMSRVSGKSVSHSSSYTINNTVDYPIVGLNLYGKSAQNGTPTPDNPVDIVSIGDVGNIQVKSCGENILNPIPVSNAYYNDNGEIVESANFNMYDFMKIDGKTLTLTAKQIRDTEGLRYALFDKDKNARELEKEIINAKSGTSSLDRSKSKFKKVVNFVKDNKEVVSVLASVVLALASKNNDLDGKK